MNTLMTHIQTATQNNCQTKTIKYSQTYIPTHRIKQKLKQLQSATQNHYTYGHPTLNKLHEYKQELLTLIYDENGNNWDNLVKEAAECHGNPSLF